MAYPGSKTANGNHQNIINLFPPHSGYIELFAGTGKILRTKKRAQYFNMAVEINRKVADKYLAMRDCKVMCYKTFLIQYNSIIGIDTLIYMDPPYPIETRRSKRKLYKFEMNHADHLDLLSRANKMYCKVAISSYENELYDNMLVGWYKHKFPSATNAGKAIECVYMNYPPPEELHEYTWLGKDFTDRQRIKRKLEREANKLMRLKPQERNAIIEMISSGNYRQK